MKTIIARITTRVEMQVPDTMEPREAMKLVDCYITGDENNLIVIESVHITGTSIDEEIVTPT